MYKSQSKLELPLSQAMAQSLEEYCIYIGHGYDDVLASLPWVKVWYYVCKDLNQFFEH